MKTTKKQLNGLSAFERLSITVDAQKMKRVLNHKRSNRYSKTKQWSNLRVPFTFMATHYARYSQTKIWFNLSSTARGILQLREFLQMTFYGKARDFTFKINSFHRKCKLVMWKCDALEHIRRRPCKNACAIRTWAKPSLPPSLCDIKFGDFGAMSETRMNASGISALGHF